MEDGVEGITYRTAFGIACRLAGGWPGSVFGPRFPRAQRSTGVRRRTPATRPVWGKAPNTWIKFVAR